MDSQEHDFKCLVCGKRQRQGVDFQDNETSKKIVFNCSFCKNKQSLTIPRKYQGQAVNNSKFFIKTRKAKDKDDEDYVILPSGKRLRLS